MLMKVIQMQITTKNTMEESKEPILSGKYIIAGVILSLTFIISVISLIFYQLDRDEILDTLEFLNIQSEQTNIDLSSIKGNQDNVTNAMDSISIKVNNIDAKVIESDININSKLDSLISTNSQEFSLIKNSMIDMLKEITSIKNDVNNITKKVNITTP